MFARRKKAHSQEANGTNILLLLVILSVVIPTVGFLWFMTRAMNNERAAMREQSKELQEMHLSDGKRLVERALKRMASGSITALNEVNLTEAQRFHHLCKRGLADSLLCLSADGEPSFPFLADSLDELSLVEADEKAMALVNGWAPEDGYPGLLQAFERDQCKNGRDWYGRYIYPNLQLTALEALPSESAVFTRIAAELGKSLALREVPWPSAQHLSLATSLRQLGHPVEVQSESGIQLALDALEYPIQLGQAGVLQTSPSLKGVWRLLTEDRRFLLIFKTETIRHTLETAAQKSSGEYASAITVVPNDTLVAESMPVSAVAPQWHLAISGNALTAQTDPKQRGAFILAMSCMIVALIGVISTFAIRRFLAQSRMTQLRNDFLSTISHELKTPLASTRMLVDTLVDGNVKDPDKTRNYLEVIGRENTRLSHLVENFLTYSRLESGRMPFDFQAIMPEEVANQALDAMESKLFSNEVDLQVSLAEGLPYVRADEVTLCIALINLLDNAYKYTGATKAIRLDVRPEGQHVRFSVQDNGVGLSASQRESVKERFYRVNESESHGGSGLGLSIVSDIANAHQGELIIESLPGEGSIFTLMIPITGNR
ncbi:MAG: GHKL domain-containing protein [Verrucomicrobiaceae bacterium]|nr:GHKL domain-containing protein [Verrucomicrobiaceae bacterium]